MLKYIYLHIIILFCCIPVYAQEYPRHLKAKRIAHPPVIDGRIDDTVWNNSSVANGFVQYEPYNGQKANKKTEAMILYDDDAIYVGAYLYDHPDSIQVNLSKRDEWQTKADKFGFWVSPYNDGVNGYEFWVTAANVQTDFKKTVYRSDRNWDEVWKSEVSMFEKGWTVEMRIPFAAIRFPNKEIQRWGINFFRIVNRTGEESSWNLIDVKIPGTLNQMGVLQNIQNVIPPLRLTFSPYASSYIENTAEGNTIFAYKGGMDFRYGINESYTLDMMVIPDFGQVQSDNIVLNLSPFEVKYKERRQFFIEGSEMFNKGNIFYSKRIGGQPLKYNEVEEVRNNTEIITGNPSNTQIINATKITGRSDHGLGIGVLNAMTTVAHAKTEDSLTNETRTILTQPFTNYNVMVLDQSLKNNSYASLVNTNYYNHLRNADVAATDFSLKNKRNTYEITGIGAFSRTEDKGEPAVTGHRYYLRFGKIGGDFRYNISRSLRSNDYEINDMGFMSRNNVIYNRLKFSYIKNYQGRNILKTVHRLITKYDQLYSPRNFMQFRINAISFVRFKDYSTMRFSGLIRPVEEHDYFEPRIEGRVFKDRPFYYLSARYSTDQRKDFSVSGSFTGWQTLTDKEAKGYSYSVSPYVAVSQRLTIDYKIEFNRNNNNRGYVAHTANEDTIFLGLRDLKTIENIVSSTFSFTDKASISFRMRHYWSEVKYKDYYILNEDGYLDESRYAENHDKNFNVFNIDMIYSWRFAPGSEMSVMWKNIINTSDEDEFYPNYFTNFGQTIISPQSNTISVKILYYLDYLNIKNIFI